MLVWSNASFGACIKVVNRYNQSTLTQYFMLDAGDDKLHVRGIVDYYNPDSSDAEDGEVAEGNFYYQIKALSLADITVK